MSREEELIEAALSLFAEKGYHGGSISQITKRAGVAKGLFYHYFSSKKELLVRLAEMRLNEWAPLVKALESSRPAHERLIQLVDFVLHELVHEADRLRLLNGVFLTGEGREAIALAMDRYAISFGRLAEAEIRLFSELGFENPERESTYFRSILQGISLEYLLMEEEYPLEEMRDELLRRYL